MNNRAFTLEFCELLSSLPEDKRHNFLASYAERAKNPVVGFGLSVYFGALGIDRFYRGQIILGILKLITFGGIGIWSLIDLFITASHIRDQNLTIAREIKQSIS